MKTKLWIFSCMAVEGLCCGAAWAQTPPPAATITLAQAVDAAWQRTQAGAAPAALALRAAAEQQAAGSLLAAPPALEVSYRQDRWQSNLGVQERELGIALPLWLPGQRAARQAAARAEQGVAALSMPAARLRLAGQVRELAWGLAGARAEADAAQAQQRYLSTLSDDVARRVRAGDLARSDALAAQGERLAAEAETLALAQRLEAQQQRWTALTGLSAESALDPMLAETPRAEPGLAAHPLLQLAAQATDAARQQAEVARLNRSDAPELSLSYRDDRSERGQLPQRSLAIALRLPLGGDARNLPLRAAAQAALDNALAEETRLRLELAAELAVARQALQASTQQVALQRERAQLLRQRAELLARSFQAGQTALPELLLSAQGAAQAEAALARELAATGAARARLQQASGLLP